MNRASVFAAVGTGLIAIDYGIARFAYGLFVPSMRVDLSLDPAVMGTIGALAFVSYAVAIAVAPILARWLGARGVAITAAAFAVAGLSTMAGARSGVELALGVLICGISTGLISPAMTAAVEATIRPALQGRLNAIINSGTSLGIVAVVPVAAIWAASWRSAYAAFAALAVVGLVAAWAGVPRAATVSGAPSRPRSPVTRKQWRSLVRLAAFALAMGVVCAPYWVFAPDLAVSVGNLAPGRAGLIWLAVGIGGLAGALAGDLVSRHGPAMAHAFALAGLSAALALIAASPGELLLAGVSAAVFGAAYMTLTAVYIVAGISIVPDHPALGPVLPFLALAVGQAIGSPLAGAAISHMGYTTTFSTFAAAGLLLASASLRLVSPDTRGDARPAAAQPDPCT